MNPPRCRTQRLQERREPRPRHFNLAPQAGCRDRGSRRSYRGRGRNVAIRAKSVGPEGPPTNAR
ncbi:DUF6053 domain-containing protein [Lysobacter enzymogenes]|uniref:DUF6053 domain-containing protein n=1 Tax=Lysobacter enzymogenes TaxID=69 RepID=UPI003D18D926